MRVDNLRDNEGSKAIEENPSSASRNKHVDVKLNFIRELICSEEVKTFHVGTEEKHSDVLTKALWRKKILVDRAALMNLS